MHWWFFSLWCIFTIMLPLVHTCGSSHPIRSLLFSFSSLCFTTKEKQIIIIIVNTIMYVNTTTSNGLSSSFYPSSSSAGICDPECQLMQVPILESALLNLVVVGAIAAESWWASHSWQHGSQRVQDMKGWAHLCCSVCVFGYIWTSIRLCVTLHYYEGNYQSQQ